MAPWTICSKARWPIGQTQCRRDGGDVPGTHQQVSGTADPTHPMTNTELLEVKGPGPDWDELQSPPAEALATPDHLEGQDDLDLHKAQGHLLLALMGKRVLRPGGMELTRCMIEALAVGPEDQVVELAPGLGTTAALAWPACRLPYTGVDHDPRMVDQLSTP